MLSDNIKSHFDQSKHLTLDIYIQNSYKETN